jgi:hypothetical protein
MKVDGKEFERNGYKSRDLEKKETMIEARNFSNPEPLNTSHIGRSLTVTLINGRIESGILRKLGAYMISLDCGNNVIILNKVHIVKVVVL